MARRRIASTLVVHGGDEYRQPLSIGVRMRRDKLFKGVGIG